MNNQRLRNWSELPSELTSEILSRVGAVDILLNAQKVCKSWYHVCKEPLMWRKINMWCKLGVLGEMDDSNLEIMCRGAVDRSQGGLVEIDIWKICSDELLNYIANRSSNLRCIKLQRCYPRLTDNGLVSALMKLPFLEDLDISFGYGKVDLKAVGNCCPLLKTFKLNGIFYSWFIKYDDENLEITGCDDEALAIAQTMSELRHLELRGNTLTNTGLKAILDNCLHLELLDLQDCLNLKLVGDLEKQCFDRIRYLRY